MIHNYLRQDGFRICVFIATNALLCNFLPPSEMLADKPKLRYCYEVVIDLMAGFALNWRERLPSLNRQFPGFRRMLRHKYRNWQQTRFDNERR
jgi:hypothetical protein